MVDGTTGICPADIRISIGPGDATRRLPEPGRLHVADPAPAAHRRKHPSDAIQPFRSAFHKRSQKFRNSWTTCQVGTLSGPQREQVRSASLLRGEYQAAHKNPLQWIW